MKVNIFINYPENEEELQRRASELLSSILVKKLEPKEIYQLIKLLKDDSKKISW